MVQLRESLRELGFSGVNTYLQSGNMIFSTVAGENPFVTQPGKNQEHLYVTFLSSLPGRVDQPALEARKKLGVTATTRNWRTSNELLRLASAGNPEQPAHL
jgi:uncharacterized protein (DUF1697 family)